MDFAPVNYLSLKESASYYAAQGIAVFPLVAGTKMPIKDLPWKQCATTDSDIVSQWWSMYPNANIGLPMGAQAGMNCLDVDVKNGKDGFASLAAVTADQYAGPVQVTPSGGQHWFYLYEPGFSNFVDKGPSGGLDMRTDNGYVVAAPSVVDGFTYYWQPDRSPTVTDAAFDLRVFFQHSSTASTHRASDTPDEPDDPVDYCTLGLSQKYLDYLADGNTDPWGNDESQAIFSVAGALMRATQDAAQTFGVLVSNSFAYACAERHRQHGNPSDWLWKYGISKIVVEATRISAADMFKPLADLVTVPDVPLPPWLAEINEAEATDTYPASGNFFISAEEGFARFMKPTTWVVHGVLELGQTGSMYGPSGSYKTFMALDLCLHISLGLAWHGRQTYLPGYCMYITAEGLGAIWRRVEAWRQHYNHANSANVTRGDIDASGFVISSTGVDLLDVKTLEPVVELIQEKQMAPRLMVVDTMASNMYGNENSTEDVTRMVNNVKALSNSCGCSTMFVHHTGHSDTGRMRGASALYAGLDFVLQIARQKDATRFIEIKGTKAKDSSEMAATFFELKTVSIAGMVDQDGSASTSLAPVLTDKAYDNVSTGAQIGLKGREPLVLNTALTFIRDQKQLGDVGDGRERQMVTASELLPVYSRAYYDENAREYTGGIFNLSRTLVRLVRKGMLDMELHNDTSWFMSATEEKQSDE